MKETSWRIFRPSPASTICAATPELARYSFATAVILGDAGRVRTELGRDPGLATQADTRTGWAPLHAASASWWHRLDPARAGGPLAVARMLLDAGADPNGRTGEAGGHGGWTPLRRGACVEARDTTWDSTPMEWAAVGSGEQPASHPHPDWTGTAQALLDAGASARDITLSPDDPKPPSPEVAALLRRHGGQ